MSVIPKMTRVMGNHHNEVAVLISGGFGAGWLIWEGVWDSFWVGARVFGGWQPL